MITDKVHDVKLEEPKQLLIFTAYQSFFIFDRQYYPQIDGLVLGLHLGSTIDNAFLFHVKIKLLECSVECLPNVYKGYVYGF